MLDGGIAHLQEADPTLAEVIDRVGREPVEARLAGVELDHYSTLIRAIVGQQVSTKAAATIFGRLKEMFGGVTPTPEQVLAAGAQRLRSVGLSGMKAGYLVSLAEHVHHGGLELGALDRLTDEEIVRELTAVKGIGEWTAQMFLLFHLRRPDVLPTADIGIQQAVMTEYALPARPGAVDLEGIAQPWRPHRSVACLFLWASLAAPSPV